MDEKIITPEGLKKAREEARKTVTRLIAFPDGITRHITLPGWKWAVLDRFERDDITLSVAQVISHALKMALADKRYPDEPFEETLRHHLSVALDAAVPFSSSYIEDHANDVCSGPKEPPSEQ
jgi:hypothetical protein